MEWSLYLKKENGTAWNSSFYNFMMEGSLKDQKTELKFQLSPTTGETKMSCIGSAKLPYSFKESVSSKRT